MKGLAKGLEIDTILNGYLDWTLDEFWVNLDLQVSELR